MDLHDPLETRDSLAQIITMVSNEIHGAVVSLCEEDDELVITVARRLSQERELDYLRGEEERDEEEQLLALL